MFESYRVKGLIFDCYHTIVDIKTDESDYYTYDTVSKWLQYQGVMIDPERLKGEYHALAKETVEASGEEHAEIRVEEVFERICRENSVWGIDEHKLGIETSKVFRSASLRKIGVFPESLKIIEETPHLKKCILSNGQRIFSELELRFLGLYDLFDIIIFSSDVRYKKPDPKIYRLALEKMQLEPREVIFIGDTLENDIIAPQEVGMQAMHIQDAWKLLP
ncbi:MAG: putative hydrolase of the superfamily [Methanolobus sp.]|jgi:putative hydrolase of the HAD superfamily|nr:putative hydrolase of the superfamily [Methanolobus sp.]MDN5310520.1 putative hydrolase of the superfamily [Methanolobus sp.]